MIYQKNFQSWASPSKAHISCCHYKSDANGSFPMHCHMYYEISYIISGRRYEFFNGMNYEVSEGSLFFIPPLTVHANKNITAVEDIVVQFSPDFICSVSELLKPDMIISLANNQQPYLNVNQLPHFKELFDQLKENSDNYFKELSENNYIAVNANTVAMLEWQRNGMVFLLLSLLLQTKYLRISTEHINYSKLLQLDKVTNYILTHPAEKISMDEAARMMGMSYYHFSRFFKETTGFNFPEYCNLLRIHYAEELLLNTEQSIADIAMAIGIDTPSYFTRIFKKINGNSPAAYRLQWKTQK